MPADVKPKPITSLAFHDAIVEQGIVVPERVVRITVIADVQDVVRIQYDCIADERLLALVDRFTLADEGDSDD